MTLEDFKKFYSKLTKLIKQALDIAGTLLPCERRVGSGNLESGER